eukprot:285887_1
MLSIAFTVIVVIGITIAGTNEEKNSMTSRLLPDGLTDNNKKNINLWCDRHGQVRQDEEKPTQNASYWVKSGWLPKKDKIHRWFKKLNDTLDYDIRKWDPTVIKLYDYIEYHPSIRQGTEEMIEQAISDFGSDTPIQSVVQMCSALNGILKLTPQYSNDEEDPLIGVPMAALFADVATNHAGHSMFQHVEFNSLLKDVLDKWKTYLDSSDSFTAINNGNWLSQDAQKAYLFDNYITPLDEPPYWRSWNDFFTRQYKPGIRQNYGENDDSKIQLPNDGVEVRYAIDINDKEVFWLKDMPYSLHDLFGLTYAKYVSEFNGGSIFQSYLDPFNYHQYNMPVDGVVVESDILEGAYFPQLVWQYDVADPGAGTLSLPWLLHVNARGIFIIDTTGYANIGLMCIVAIGMGDVSSVIFYPNIGDKVSKGDVFGAFKFGGSSIAIITQDMSKYGKKLEYDSKFIPNPTEEDHITFLVGEILATVYDS